MPPKVPVPKPGPCPKAGNVAKKAIAGIAPKPAAKRKPVAKKKTPAKAAPERLRVQGRDVREELDYDKLESLYAPSRDSKKGDDTRLKEIARVQGFDGLPQLGNSDTLRDIRRAGGIELWRGVKEDSNTGRTAQDFVNEFIDGEARYGFGFFGNGVYAADNLAEARRYGSGIIRMALPKNAKIGDYDTLKEEMQRATPPVLQHKREDDQRKLMEMIGKASTEDEVQKALDAFDKVGSRGRAKDLLTSDVGLYAMSKGYDAIKVSKAATGEGQPYYVILNRSAVTVQDDRIKDGQPVAPPFFRTLSMDDAAQMQRDMGRDRPLSQRERDAVSAWTGSGYFDFQGMIRDPQGWDPAMGIGNRATVREHVKQLQSAMRPLPDNIKAFRVGDLRPFGLVKGEDPAKLVGQRKQSAGFLATSVQPGLAFGGVPRDVEIELDIPKGTPAVYVEPWTQTKGEGELLLPPGQIVEWTEATIAADGKVKLKGKVITQ